MNLYLKECLEEAGWYEGRKIEVGYMIEEISKIGYSTGGSYVNVFLQEFGNLLIEFNTPGKKTSNVKISSKAAQELYPEETSRLSDLANDQIIPVGYIQFETALLLISSQSGKFYMSTDGGFYKLGNDFMETLEIIVYQKDLIRISITP